MLCADRINKSRDYEGIKNTPSAFWARFCQKVGESRVTKPAVETYISSLVRFDDRSVRLLAQRYRQSARQG